MVNEITTNNTHIEKLNPSINMMCVHSKSGISYIEVGSQCLQVEVLNNPVQVESYRGDNNDPIK